MNRFLTDLRILASTVSRMDEAILVFDAIAENVATVNGKGFGAAFGYIQSVALTDLIISFGRLVSKGKKEISFRSVSLYIESEPVVNLQPLREYLTNRGVKFKDKSADVCLSFKTEFSSHDHVGYEKLLTLRNKLVAHHDHGAKWESIGASFIDARSFVKEAYEKIDICFSAFFNQSKPSQSLSAIDGQHAKRTDRTFRKLIAFVQNA